MKCHFKNSQKNTIFCFLTLLGGMTNKLAKKLEKPKRKEKSKCELLRMISETTGLGSVACNGLDAFCGTDQRHGGCILRKMREDFLDRRAAWVVRISEREGTNDLILEM